MGDGVATGAGGTVIVPAIGVASSVAALRSLGRRGIRTVAVSEKPNPPGFDSKYCSEAVAVPDPTVELEAYGDALFELARRDDVQTVLPFREEDVYSLSKRRDELSIHIGTPWPSLDRLRHVQDRVSLFEIAREADVPAPKTTLLDDWEDWSRGAVVKPRYTVPAEEFIDHPTDDPPPHIGSARFVGPEERPDRSKLVNELGHVPIVQEYVPGPTEYGFFALYDRGRAVATFQHRQIRGYKYCGGPSAFRESTAIPALEDAGRRLLDRLDWHGVAMVEFLRDETTGEFKLMEVNPRLWSSLPFTIQAGVDFPTLAYRLSADVSIDEAPRYEVGIAGHLIRGELLHLHSVLFEEYPLVDRPSPLRTAFDIGSSIARHRRFDYLSTDDPGPFLRDLTNTIVGTGADWKASAIGDRPVLSPRRVLK